MAASPGVFVCPLQPSNGVSSFQILSCAIVFSQGRASAADFAERLFASRLKLKMSAKDVSAYLHVVPLGEAARVIAHATMAIHGTAACTLQNDVIGITAPSGVDDEPAWMLSVPCQIGFVAVVEGLNAHVCHAKI